MQNRYEALFAGLRQQGRKAFIPYTVLGYPDAERSYEAIECMISAGAAALELGLAFSDPLADGAVIQEACGKTISSGFRNKQAFELIARLRAKHESLPICLMCYYNSLLAMGLSSFCRQAADSGVDAILVVDLPPDESSELTPICREYGLRQVFIISPLTTDERFAAINEKAGAFLYAVSRLGVTGAEERYDHMLSGLLSKAAGISKLPIAVGFGISTPEQAGKMYQLGADAVVTGTRIIEIIDSDCGSGNFDSLSAYIKSMVEAGSSKLGQ